MGVDEISGLNDEGNPTVTDYKFTNVLKYDLSPEEIHVKREIDLVEFNCVFPTEQITSTYMQPWIKWVARTFINMTIFLRKKNEIKFNEYYVSYLFYFNYFLLNSKRYL